MGVKWYGASVAADIERKLEVSLEVLGGRIISEAQRSMRRPKHGRDYRETPGHSAQILAEDKAKGMSGDPFDFGSKMSVGRRKKWDYWTTRSSAPYEPPAAQQKQLMLSLHQKKTGRLQRKVGSNIEKALYLEVGTRNMVERPWLRPALFKFTGRVGEELFEELI